MTEARVTLPWEDHLASMVLHPGDLIVLQPRSGVFDQATAAQMRELLKPFEEKHGISFLVVDASVDMTVMRRPKKAGRR